MFSAKLHPKAMIASALVAATAAGTLPTAAQAQGGDITRGVILGLVTGYAVNQIMHAQHPQGTVVQSTSNYQPAYVPQRYVEEAAPVRYQPAPTYTPDPVYAPSTISPQQTAFVSQERKVRLSIQYQLMRDGYYSGAIDGLWGPGTEDALYHYAQANNQVSMLTTKHSTERLFSQILR